MDITVDRQHPVPGRRHRRVPWSPRAWGQVLYLAGGIPVQLSTLAALLLLARATHEGQPAPLALFWLLVAAGLFLVSPVLTRVHRHRLRATAGVEIPRQPKRRGLFTWPGLTAELRSQATWRQLGYHVIVAPMLAVAAAVAVGLWPASIACIITFAAAWSSRLPAGSFFTRQPLATSHPLMISLTFVGVAALFAAPWLTSGIRTLDIRAARALLGPSRADELEHRVEQLTETRAGVVDAADAERRRLERDLHDGTQQRLVSLAINLGMARAQAGTAEEAKQAIAEAHEEAKSALAKIGRASCRERVSSVV